MEAALGAQRAMVEAAAIAAERQTRAEKETADKAAAEVALGAQQAKGTAAAKAARGKARAEKHFARQKRRTKRNLAATG